MLVRRAPEYAATKKRVEVSKQPRAAEKKRKIVNKNIHWGHRDGVSSLHL